jgi:hypothetical protein
MHDGNTEVLGFSCFLLHSGNISLCTGNIDIGEGLDPLLFSVDLDMEETLFMVGINKDIGRNWSLAALLGFNGTREQATVVFGYRW